MNQNVTAAVNAARQAIQAETARVKKEIVLHEGELRSHESKLEGLKKQLTELEPLLARFDGQPAKAPPTDDDVGKFVTAMMTPAKATRKKPTPKKKASLAEKVRAAVQRPTSEPLRAQVFRLLSDMKARESSDIEAALPSANPSTVRSAIHSLVSTGEVLARGESGRRRYVAAQTAVARLATAATNARRSTVVKAATRPAPLRDMVTRYLRTRPMGSSEEIFDYVSKHSATSRTTLSVMLSSMKKSGLLVAAPFTPAGGGHGYLYSVAATPPLKVKTPREAPVRELILSHLRAHPRSTAAEVFAGVKPRYEMSRSNLGTHLYDMKELKLVVAERDPSRGDRLLYSAQKPPSEKTLSADKPKPAATVAQGRPGPNGVLSEMILDIARQPVSVETIRAAVEKARPGTTKKTIWSSLKDLRQQGRLHATGPRGQYRYLRIWK